MGICIVCIFYETGPLSPKEFPPRCTNNQVLFAKTKLQLTKLLNDLSFHFRTVRQYLEKINLWSSEKFVIKHGSENTPGFCISNINYRQLS